MKLEHAHRRGHAHQHYRLPSALADSQPSQLESEAVGTPASIKAIDGVSRLTARENDTSEKPVGNSNTLAIALGIIIPLGLALIVLLYLHRKNVVRQRQEDKADNAKYKSMDFGLGDAGTGPVKGAKRRSAFFGKEKDANHKTQLSMDMNLSSPYLLPPTLQNSRESMNSLAKTLHQNEDPYRPIYAGSDVASMKGRDSKRSTQEPPSYRQSLTAPALQQPPPAAQSPRLDGGFEDESVLPPKNDFGSTDNGAKLAQVPQIQEPAAVAQVGRQPVLHQSRPLSDASNNADQSYVADIVNERDSVPAEPRVSSPPQTNSLPLRDNQAGDESTQPKEQSAMLNYQDQAHQFQIDVPSPNFNASDVDELHMGGPADHEYPQSAGLDVPAADNRRLSVGLRPLPPDDFLESEDPEFRANRIRSFYKEYFEDSNPKTDAGVPPPLPQQPPRQQQQKPRFEDYDAGYGAEAAYFDPETNAFVMPYAQPVTRRAMTPPPQNRRPMPGPRPRGPHGPQGSFSSMNMPGGPPRRPRAGSTMSAGRFGPPRSPRPDSSASNRPPNMGGKPKKPLPPPAALNTLPTPSKLKDDAFSILNPLDFAPPPTFKDQAAGRSQSPVGERRPYALNTPIASPLVSAFEETAALPSPHLLRKSGTFTALDFAPPKRFKDNDAMSETGSVHSARSGISNTNLSAIRGGAGRVSRLPGDTVFSQAALGDTLKPSWGMRQ
ncbi:hypothetical protein F4780DRAFT_719484 [Xylariomycetidae sp. FL0641]|nr:hypothetical protein F4780DRAFT_719484 [Xylariomycetidae sp. FL0641]